MLIISFLCTFCTPYYDNQYDPRNTLNSSEIKEIILYPNKFNLSTGNESLELWNKGNVATTVNNNYVYKTIYSPSPYHYVEPKSAAFTGFTTTGGNSRISSQYNVSAPFYNGWYFYCQPNYKGNTIYLVALGMRSWQTGAINSLEAWGYWLAIPSSITYSLYLDLSPSYVFPYDNYYRNLGLCLLSAIE